MLLRFADQDFSYQLVSAWQFLKDEELEQLLACAAPEAGGLLLYQMGRAGDSRAFDGLVALLHEQNSSRLRKDDTISALASLGGDRARKALLAYYPQADDPTREGNLLPALGRIGDKETAEALLEMIHAEETTNPFYLDGLANLFDLTGDLAVTAAMILCRLGDQRGGEMALEVLRHASTFTTGWDAGMTAAYMLSELVRQGDEQVQTILHNLFVDGRSERFRVAGIWRQHVFLRTGGGMDILAFWPNLGWMPVDRKQSRRIISREALEKLLRFNDPRDLYMEILALWTDGEVFTTEPEPFRSSWPEWPLETTYRETIYQILLTCAPLLQQITGDVGIEWRRRLMRPTQDLLPEASLASGPFGENSRDGKDA